MKHFFHHLFFPRHTNNFRPRLVHHLPLAVLTLLFFSFSVFITFTKAHYPSILGVSYSITAQELLDATNRERVKHGQEPLNLNLSLIEAANGKASHMFANNYWAHFAPDGTTPWVFIKNAGYEYAYAGENLAKGFTSSQAVVDAWMKSPTHRENILSNKYSEIGFAINEGRLQGEDTVLVVQMFGGKDRIIAAAPQGQEDAVIPVEIPEVVPQQVLQEQVISHPVVNAPATAKSIGILTTVFFVAILIMDFIIIERKKIPRVAGHNMDHILLFVFFLLFIILERSTGIL